MINIAKDRLVKLLDQALPQSQVIYGPATNPSLASDRILKVGDAQGVTNLDSMAGETEQEQYLIELIISVDLVGSDQQACTEMAIADFYAAKRAMREYATGFDLGLNETVQILPTTGFQLEERADSTGRHCMIKFGAQVTAQNT